MVRVLAHGVNTLVVKRKTKKVKSPTENKKEKIIRLNIKRQLKA